MKRQSWREGTLVKYTMTPWERVYHATSDYAGKPPKNGEIGRVAGMSFGSRGKKTFLAGPGGGLVYVQWPSIGMKGVPPSALTRLTEKEARMMKKLGENPPLGTMLYSCNCGRTTIHKSGRCDVCRKKRTAKKNPRRPKKKARRNP